MCSDQSHPKDVQSENNSPSQSSLLAVSNNHSNFAHLGGKIHSPSGTLDGLSFDIHASHFSPDLARFIDSPSRVLEMGAFDINMQSYSRMSPAENYKDSRSNSSVIAYNSLPEPIFGQISPSIFTKPSQVDVQPKDSVSSEANIVSQNITQESHGKASECRADPPLRIGSVQNYMWNVNPPSYIDDDECKKLVPLINKLNPNEYEGFLVDVLRDISQDIPLGEFYDLLHTFPAPVQEIDIDSSVTKKAKLKGLRICHFILEAFGRPTGSKVRRFVTNDSIESIKFKEFIRSFFAIKILLDSIEVVHGSASSQTSVPRASIHKAYCILCEKIAKSSTRVQFCSKREKKFVMGISQLGKIIQLVFPNPIIRRLGRRGYSRYHYVGMAWNPSIIDSGLSDFLEIENSMPLRQSYDHDRRRGKKRKMVDAQKSQGKEREEYSHNSREQMTFLYSYISTSSKLPEKGCSPRNWEFTPGRVPKPSDWSSKIMARTLKSLRAYKVDMEPVIQNLKEDFFEAEKSNLLLANFLSRINILIKSNADGEAFMLLYLTILLLLFPVVLASDAEIPYDKKVQMRKNLASFVSSLRFGIAHLPQNESSHFMNFLHMIRKMMHISEMTSSYVQTNLTKKIVSEIVGDLQKQAATNFEICKTANEEIIFNSVVIASKANQNAFLGLNPIQSNEMIVNVARAFAAFAFAGTKQLMEVPGSMSIQDLENDTFDLPFKMFKNSARFFHEICLSDPHVMKLPISVINFILFKMNKEVQDLSFGSFANRQGEVSKETFKTWWVHSTLAEEYMQIFAEIVSLVAKLPETIRKRQ